MSSDALSVVSQTSIQELAERVVALGTEAHLSVACAESCTGGLVCSAITDVAGSSSVLKGGVVSYAIDIKRSVLGVSPSVLDVPELGAVSSECASQMCAGVARLMNADIALSVTGIAGPGGAEPGKPVGTVFFGLWTAGTVHTERHLFEGSRTEVRTAAVARALELICEGIMQLS